MLDRSEEWLIFETLKIVINIRKKKICKEIKNIDCV